MFDVLLSSDGEWYTLPLKWRNKKEQPFARERKEQGEIYAEIMVDLSYIGFLFNCQPALKN